MKHLTAHVALLGLLATAASAQYISYSAIGSIYEQDFNPSSGIGLQTLAWSDDGDNSAGDLDLEGWYAFNRGGNTAGVTAGVTNTIPNGLRVSNSINSTGSYNSLYLFRSSASSTDMALGSQNLDTTGDITFGVRFRNDSGVTLDSITITYTGEQWYRSSSTNAQYLTPGYYIDTAGTLLSEQSVGTPSTFTAFSGISFSSPSNTGSAGSIDGNTYSESFSITVTGLTWTSGTDLYIRWFNANDSGADHALAIDDFTFSATSSAVPEPSAFAAFAGLAALGFVASRRRARR